MNRTDATDRATWLLDRFGIADAADRLVRTWSGGMARKLDVAIGLVHRPQVLFLDEPTTGLDPEARAEMWAEIGRMAGDDRMTVLLTTHYLDEADRLANRLAIVEHGRVAVEGTPDAAQERAARRRAAGRGRGRGSAARSAARLLGTVTGCPRCCATAAWCGRAPTRAPGSCRQCSPRWPSAGLGVVSATVARPSLDDVYLRYAGRSFEAEAVAS